ncbi:MAG: alanine:cation symporter family protein, partial [Coprobacter sp.]|nr:alanine:cation symporter family protein [Coprobacter sp.]
MDLFLTIVDFLWNNIMVEVMVVIALWFTIKTKAVQITMFPEMIRTLKGTTQKQSGEGRSISSVEAFLISLASRVGVGNLAGVALAITIGGPGAIFWMWVMAILNSATSFVESTLAQLYKSRNGNFFIGGPAYYIYKGLKSKTWAVIVAILSVLTFSFIICSVQSNTIAISAGQAFGISPIWSAIIIGVLMSLTIFGGVGRVAKVTSTLVPLMAFAYILVVVSIVLANIGQIPAIFKLIIDSAFGVEQVVAGGVGTAIMMGVKRGLF